MGNRDDVDAILEETGWPVTWRNSDNGTAIVDGQQIGVHKKYARGAGPLHLSGAEFTYDLGGRPIHMKVHSVEHTSTPAKRRLQTGDPVFDREMAVEGWPAEVVVASLDQEARDYLPGAVRPRWPWVWTEDGHFRMSTTMFHERRKPVAGPAEVAASMRFVAGTGSRLVAAYDARFDEIRRTQGDAAAEAWRDASKQKSRGRAGKRALSNIVTILLVLGVVAGVSYAMIQGWF